MLTKSLLADPAPVKDLTDWARLHALTEDEIERAADDDPDSDFDVDWSKAVLVEPQKKVAISIRLDEDVLDFFKSLGPGYQPRINSVLRHYVTTRKAAAKPEDAAE